MVRSAMVLAALLVMSVSATSAQVLIPNKPHETLDFELHAMRDKVTLYMGDPQELLRLWCRPVHVKPRVEYTGQVHATLRIRDPQIFEKAPPGDPDSMTPNQREKYLSVADINVWMVVHVFRFLGHLVDKANGIGKCW